MVLLKLFCSTLLSAWGLATTVVEPLAPPSRLVRLAVLRSCLRFCCSSATSLPSLLMDPQARARVHFLRVACCVLAVEEAGHADSL